MWSRREQHHAYQFLTRRITSAMLSGEPDSNELPMRRFGVALFSGVAVALLLLNTLPTAIVTWGVSSSWQPVVEGVVLAVALAVNSVRSTP